MAKRPPTVKSIRKQVTRRITPRTSGITREVSARTSGVRTAAERKVTARTTGIAKRVRNSIRAPRAPNLSRVPKRATTSGNIRTTRSIGRRARTRVRQRGSSRSGDVVKGQRVIVRR
jgi:hypothetical protein